MKIEHASGLGALAKGIFGAALTLAAGSLQAGLIESNWTFTGSDQGGTVTATMDISINDVTNVLTLTLNNTSPLTLDSGSGVNTPGIDGFGFNLDPNQSWSSWNLTAFTTGTPQGTAVIIGSNTTPSPWSLLESQNNQGIKIDYNPNNGAGISEALYNPSATEGFSGQTQYFTQAVFTIFFDGLPVLAEEDCGSDLDCTTFVRAQAVGDGGSLKLPGSGPGPGPGPGPDGAEIPLPGTLLLVGLGLLGLRHTRRRTP
jgi:hypothetical protein